MFADGMFFLGCFRCLSIPATSFWAGFRTAHRHRPATSGCNVPTIFPAGEGFTPNIPTFQNPNIPNKRQRGVTFSSHSHPNSLRISSLSFQQQVAVPMHREVVLWTRRHGAVRPQDVQHGVHLARKPAGEPWKLTTVKNGENCSEEQFMVVVSQSFIVTS